MSLLHCFFSPQLPTDLAEQPITRLESTSSVLDLQHSPTLLFISEWQPAIPPRSPQPFTWPWLSPVSSFPSEDWRSWCYSWALHPPLPPNIPRFPSPSTATFSETQELLYRWALSCSEQTYSVHSLNESASKK